MPTSGDSDRFHFVTGQQQAIAPFRSAAMPPSTCRARRIGRGWAFLKALIFKGVMLRHLLWFLLLLVAAPATAAEWQSGPAPGDDRKKPVAWIENDDGHRLIIRGETEGRQYWVFVEFHLGGGKVLGGDIPSHEVRAGYEIDNDWQLGHADYGRFWGAVDATTASWVLATYPKDEFAAGEVTVMKDWFDGGEVAITYETDAGDRETTRFPLAGLKAAFVEATGWTIGD